MTAYDLSSLIGVSIERAKEILSTVERLFTEMQINKDPNTVINYIKNLKDDKEKVLAAFYVGILSAAIMSVDEPIKWLKFAFTVNDEIDEEVKKRTPRRDNVEVI
jgi:hypothetical protein